MKSLFAAVLVTLALPAWAGHCNSDHGEKGHDKESHGGQMTSTSTAKTDMDNYLEVAQETPTTEEAVDAAPAVAEEKPKNRYSKYYR